MSAQLSPSARRANTSVRWCGVSTLGRPKRTPRAFARLRPSPVRSRINSRSEQQRAQNLINAFLAVAQRVRDQINRAYDDVSLDAQPCLDRVIEWLDRDHLRQRPQAE